MSLLAFRSLPIHFPKLIGLTELHIVRRASALVNTMPTCNTKRNFTTLDNVNGNLAPNLLFSKHSLQNRQNSFSRNFSSTIENIHEHMDIAKGLEIDPAYGKEFEMAVLTFRADRIAGLALGYTRRKMEYAILRGLVFVNGIMLNAKSGKIKEGDTVDVIRISMTTEEKIVFDRMIFLKYLDLTKNGKQRILLRRFKVLSCAPSEFWSKPTE